MLSYREAVGGVVLAAQLLIFGPADAQVQVLDLSDLSAAPSADLPGEVVLRDEICVRVAGGQGSYRVRLDGQDGQGFALALAGGAERLPFSVAWDSRAGATEERSAPGEVGVFAVSSHGCAPDAWLASYEVRFARADMLAVPAGPYHGGLVIEISIP